MPFQITGQPMTRSPQIPTSIVASIRKQWAEELAKDALTPVDYLSLPLRKRHIICEEIRERDGLYPGRIAKRYGLHKAKVSQLINYKIYKEVS